MEKVEFTQPYAESGLSMIVPAKFEESAWGFVKPFTWELWLITGAILIYTVFIVWLLEHQMNPEFQGPRKHQICTALWFTFSSLFFAHREKIHSSLTRVVVVVWLFVALILSSSYTASLTSMLTVKQLQPNPAEINWLLRNNLTVGCDGDSFVRNYLQNVLTFNPEKIQNVSSEYKYDGEFKSNSISASFLELPYQKVFINHYCNKYIATTPIYRFGGLGFVFQKGSPIAIDFSIAILQLSENGEREKLEKKWFASSPECSSTAADSKIESLSLQSFRGLFVISGVTSTICFLVFLVHLLKKDENDQVEDRGNANLSLRGVWNKTAELASYLYHGQIVIRGRTPTSSPSPDKDEWLSPRGMQVLPIPQ
uniref:Ionotropic glutamate receptor C-terminal domain-containing protein n=1 Tax=Rhizophora mucronata TaxID=61149 RepID=A0A2P2Q6R7_RHIMU